jgi:hypothetical protein
VPEYVEVAEKVLRRMGPLTADHPLAISDERSCPGCDGSFEEGNYLTLVTIGPGADEDERAKAREGRAYNAVSVPVHWACATGLED